MFQGTVDSIYLASKEAAPTFAVSEARIIFGKGIEGDRKFDPNGPNSPDHDPKGEVTLIELESIEALHRELEMPFEPGQSRRQIVTRGVPLNHLVGKEFRVGEVVLRGMKLCEPCEHLAGMTDQRVLKGLLHRGGLRTQIVTAGTIHVGDVIEECSA